MHVPRPVYASVLTLFIAACDPGVNATDCPEGRVFSESAGRCVEDTAAGNGNTNGNDVDLVGSGSFVFGEGEIPRPLEVFYYVPSTATADSPVLFLFHGGDRDPARERNDAIAKAEEYAVIVFAPLFDSTQYPRASDYILGYVFEDGNNATGLRPASEWAFSVIEPLFDDIKQRITITAERYDVFGHSAGAQFAHRLVLFIPGGRYDRVIAANAGWYSVPDPSVDFPYGLGIAPVSGTAFFGVPLTIFLGENDTDPESPALRRNADADVQGINRFDRGQYFIAESQQIATDAGASFEWQLATAPGVGHEAAPMSALAFDLLYSP